MCFEFSVRSSVRFESEVACVLSFESEVACVFSGPQPNQRS